MECKFCQKQMISSRSVINHQSKCPSNPDRHIGVIKDKDAFSKKMRVIANKNWTPEARKKLSESMILAHQEGRAWNIGMNRWKKQPSYPEQFFILAIENHFYDKCYEREVWFKGFVLDFLWPEKKLVIEVDGKQHDTPSQKKRDEQKDALLIEDGYKVLRVRWGDVYENPTKWIQISNDFIGV